MQYPALSLEIFADTIFTLYFSSLVLDACAEEWLEVKTGIAIQS